MRSWSGSATPSRPGHFRVGRSRSRPSSTRDHVPSSTIGETSGFASGSLPGSNSASCELFLLASKNAMPRARAPRTHHVIASCWAGGTGTSSDRTTRAPGRPSFPSSSRPTRHPAPRLSPQYSGLFHTAYVRPRVASRATAYRL